MSSESASYSGRRTNRRIAESNPIEGDASIFTSRSTSSNNGGDNTEALKLYEAIIFSGPIVFTLIILFLFYFFYLRRHSVDWSSLRMRASNSAAAAAASANDVNEVGLKKEFREMLPIIVFKESFSVTDTRDKWSLDLTNVEQLQSKPNVVPAATWSWICGAQTASFSIMLVSFISSLISALIIFLFTLLVLP